MGGKKGHGKETVARLQARLLNAQIALESNPVSSPFQDVLLIVAEMLQSLDALRAKWVDQIMQARWMS